MNQPQNYNSLAANYNITSPTERDVLSGRGQGIQRHNGNAKYIKLVFANKENYAKCAKCDKSKIKKAIVAAVRELGGRFLILDERTRILRYRRRRRQRGVGED